MKTPLWFRVAIRVLAGAGFILAALFAYEFGYRYPFWTLRAFRIPSVSMCPTICSGERILVQMRGSQPYLPRRNDVIVLEYGPQRQKFIKRVIGVPGDLIAPGPGATILVNGQPWTAPPACGKPVLAKRAEDENPPPLAFKPTHVPAGQIFVIGDNLDNSFDSRIEYFEPVTFDRFFGKPVLIYFSPHPSRIGCSIQ